MAGVVDFAVITPSEVKFQGKAEIVVAPGAAGDLAALPNHAPMLTTLRVGVVRATVLDPAAASDQTAPRRVSLAVDGGFMQILPEKVVVLTDLAAGQADVDADAVALELKAAHERLAAKRGADDEGERKAVAWAEARLEVANRPSV